MTERSLVEELDADMANLATYNLNLYTKVIMAGAFIAADRNDLAEEVRETISEEDIKYLEDNYD